MINYFYKVTNFNINSAILYDEWLSVVNKHNVFQRTKEFKPIGKAHSLPFYYKVLINYPDSKNENMDPVWVHRSPNNQGIGEPNWNANNILKDWQGTYTEQVAKMVDNYIKEKHKNYKLQVITYSALEPFSRISRHTDSDPKPRFFLAVNAPEGCYMDIEGERHSMSDIGALYRLNSRCFHSPVNDTKEYRVMMTFDYLK